MKIALVQRNYHIGNFDANIAKIISAVREAREQDADLAVFAELAVCGYPPRDFLEFDDFITHCEEGIREIAAEAKGIAVVVGAPARNPRIEGKDLFNAAYWLEDGNVRKVFHKALLPNYDIFDEYRYFEPGSEFEVIEYKGRKLAVTICEDLWNVGNENPLYTINPMDELIKEQPEAIINIAASPFDYAHDEERRVVFRANTERFDIPLFYVNHVGAQTELIFDGGSLVFHAGGKVYDEMHYFKEDLCFYELEDVIASREHVHTDRMDDMGKIERIHEALVLGIKDYFGKLGFKKAILGLSGGIDSAVTLVLAARALGAENVMAVMMPSQFSSGHSVSDSELLINNLNCDSHLIPIADIYAAYEKELAGPFEGTSFGLAEENLQARSRAVLLMALSNKFGHILLNTSNKSEAAVGYSTIYGDMCGGLSVLGDVYKTEVYDLARFINKDEEVIPQNIIDKAPSAELRPDQKDSDSLPEYHILDEVLYQYVEQRKGPKELVAMGFEKTLVDRILKLVNTNEYKRFQTPPILRVSTKAFGMGRRMPIVGKYLS